MKVKEKSEDIFVEETIIIPTSPVDWQPKVILYTADGIPLRRPIGFRKS